MQITRAGEYGVLGMMYLARRDDGAARKTAMIDEVSRAEKVPKSFLAKIFQNLARAGLVKSVRGAGGGFVLAKTPTEITVLEIVEAIEGKITFQRCKQDKPDCKHIGGCALCGLFEQAQGGLTDVLTRTTLDDLIKRQERIDTTHDHSAGRLSNSQKDAIVR
ncbi:MAG: Rrf2 family transcriptional regulator [Verrucomicrobiales bacterium]|nr:Rrf2 family transcriptional regulator [Verrucomicrobiales bacterium]